MSIAGVATAAGATLGLSGAFTPANKLGTIRTAAYTLSQNQNGTDTLTLNPGELLDPAQLQADFAQYGIPAKVTTGSYCTSTPEPAGFAQAVTWQQGTWQKGSGTPSTITIDPSQIPAGTELTVGVFHLTSGPAAGEQQANFSLINLQAPTPAPAPRPPSHLRPRASDCSTAAPRRQGPDLPEVATAGVGDTPIRRNTRLLDKAMRNGGPTRAAVRRRIRVEQLSVCPMPVTLITGGTRGIGAAVAHATGQPRGTTWSWAIARTRQRRRPRRSRCVRTALPARLWRPI